MKVENSLKRIEASYTSERRQLLFLFLALAAVSVVGAIYSPALIVVFPLAILAMRYKKEVFNWANTVCFYAAILLLIPVSPYKLLSGLPVDVEFNRVAAVIVLSFWSIGLLVDPKMRLRRTHFELPLLAFSSVILLSVILNPDAIANYVQFIITGKLIIRFASFIIMLYFVATVLRDNKQADRVLKFLTVIAAIISVGGILERLTGYNFFFHLDSYIPYLYADPHSIEGEFRGGVVRVSSSIDHPIALSVVLAMLLPITVHYILESKQTVNKAFYILTAGLSIVTMFLTVSATALVALMTLVGWLMMRNFRYAMLLVLVLAFGLTVVANAFPGTVDALLGRLSPDYLIQKEIHNETGGRFSDYPKIWKEFRYKPWLGHGFGTFINDKFFYLDNQYLKFAYEIGLLGLMAFFWLCMSVINRFLKASRYLRDRGSILLAIMTSLLVYMVTCLTFDTFGFAQVTQLFFILMAIGVAIAGSTRRGNGPVDNSSQL